MLHLYACVLHHEIAVAFVVPAGGLGERLGFHGVKFALPSEISTGASVLRVCARTTR